MVDKPSISLIVDPACYPILHPYGTQGYTYGIPLRLMDQSHKTKNRDQNAAYEDTAEIFDNYFELEEAEIEEEEEQDQQETTSSKK